MLDAQIDAKRQVKEADDKANRSYMKRWMLQTEIADAQRKLKEEQRANKIKET